MDRYGPLRSPRGRVDVEVRPDVLELHPRNSPFDLADGAEIGLVVGAIAVAVAGTFLPEPLNYACFILAAVVIVGLALTYVVAYAAAAVMLVVTLVRLVTRKGRRRVRSSVDNLLRATTAGTWKVPRGDVQWVSPIDRSLRPRLRLGLPHGELVLTAWAWRRAQLEGLAQELAVSVEP
ncbi:hypothetical protein [Nocardioides sp. cx-173]|uniref:hypothetical protein n=1 Tax=Nocardioides sp. cx-173 TaxID=2898796 RepID=UPI001E34307E|nr:hypothetical protein [Nocardioides sp. cx-173]MCD4527250.1 hypothetical protein [Nocardioides sp. cx-173]UGB40373.1 hypothetical protein LQ940_13375 [Nocardioides sp. cx-173]